MSRGTDWRTRLRAAMTVLDHLAAQADSLIAAWLDIRPLRRSGADFAAWLGRTWRTHLHHAHVRRYGPGRGLLVITTHTRTTEKKESPRER